MSTAHTEELRHELEIFKSKMKVPAVAGGIVYSDGTLVSDVCGVVARGSSTPAELQHQWHIGSCSKSITAALYAKLVELGKAQWSTPIPELFPDIVDKLHPGWADRTITDVLHCRAGIKPNLTRQQMNAAWLDKRDLTEQRTDAVVAALSSTPGKHGSFVYSNLSYMIIGAAIDRLVEGSYEKAVADYVLNPLAITSLGYGAPSPILGHRPRIQFGNVCLFKGKPMSASNPHSDNPPVMSAAGTMHITLSDWAKFVRVFISKDAPVLQSDSIEQLLAVPEGHGQQMAMGWIQTPDKKKPLMAMQGSNTLWGCAAMLGEQRDRAALVMCNDGRTTAVMQSAILAERLLTISDNYS